MKKILILLSILVNLFCKAQTINVGLEYSHLDTPDGGYYKDNNNMLTPYEGTWLYTNGATSINIQLRKITHFYNGKFYEDMLVGEYKYVENGVEKINTLNLFNNNLSNQYDHKLFGNYIWEVNHKPYPCSDCSLSINRVSIAFRDPLKDTQGNMYFGISNTSNNIAKVYIVSDGMKWIYSDPNDIFTGTSTDVGLSFPNGWYTFVRQ